MVGIEVELTIQKESVIPIVRQITRFYIHQEKNEIDINSRYVFTSAYKEMETWLIDHGAKNHGDLIWGAKWYVSADVIILFMLRWG